MIDKKRHMRWPVKFDGQIFRPVPKCLGLVGEDLLVHLSTSSPGMVIKHHLCLRFDVTWIDCVFMTEILLLKQYAYEQVTDDRWQNSLNHCHVTLGKKGLFPMAFMPVVFSGAWMCSTSSEILGGLRMEEDRVINRLRVICKEDIRFQLWCGWRRERKKNVREKAFRCDRTRVQRGWFKGGK